MIEYDAGGWLESGPTAIVNTGLPEPILDAEQWEQWRRDE